MKNKVSFSSADKNKFFLTLKRRIDNYFKENNISRHANREMVIKTIVMLSLYLVPYFLIISNSISYPLMLLMYVVMGFGLAGIGMSVMHDANHGSYSSNALVNKVLGYTLNLIGANAFTWRIKHNMLHHGYTNIDGLDEDLESAGLMRMTPFAKYSFLHRFQHIYAPFVYGIVTLEWCISRDFLAFRRYIQNGIINKKNTSITKEMFILVLSKILYFFFILAVPIIVLELSIWKLLAGFVLLHFTSGLILATTFQLAHVVEKTIFEKTGGKNKIENEWAVHQMLTTANFAPESKIISWFVGGLNFQIEHHLFPNICHVHYKNIAGIVQSTASEFNVPYNRYDTFGEALKSHFKVMKQLGWDRRYSKLRSRNA